MIGFCPCIVIRCLATSDVNIKYIDDVESGAILPQQYISHVTDAAHSSTTGETYLVLHDQDKWSLVLITIRGDRVANNIVPGGSKPISGVFIWRSKLAIATQDIKTKRVSLLSIKGSASSELMSFERASELDQFLDPAKRARIQDMCLKASWFPMISGRQDTADPVTALELAFGTLPFLAANRMTWSPRGEIGIATPGMLFGAELLEKKGEKVKSTVLSKTLSSFIADEDFDEFIGIEVTTKSTAISLRDTKMRLRTFWGKLISGKWSWKEDTHSVVARKL